MTEENLIDAPEWEGSPGSCKYCVYWECPELHACSTEDAFQHKLAWVRHIRKVFGGCGKLLYLDDRTVGYAQYAPARYFPTAAEYPAGPAGEDAVLIACLFIPAPEHRGGGLGSLLLREILDELRGRGFKAVEAFARRQGSENPAGPLEFYLAHEFRIIRDDAEFPLVRLTL